MLKKARKSTKTTQVTSSTSDATSGRMVAEKKADNESAVTLFSSRSGKSTPLKKSARKKPAIAATKKGRPNLKESAKKKPDDTSIASPLPGLDLFLEKLEVRAQDSDFDTLRAMVREAIQDGARGVVEAPPPYRWQDRLIEEVVPNRATVLDVGCGEGDLLVRLSDSRKAVVQGIEINQEMAMRCIERGIPTYHGDLEKSLKNFQDKSYDFVILEETLQTLQHPIDVLRELLRIGKKVVVSIPNFAHWRVRLAFSLGGRMPRTSSLPHTWYNTPNIHLCTLNDFLDWVEEDKVKILKMWCLVNGKAEPYGEGHNLKAEQALFVLSKKL